MHHQLDEHSRLFTAILRNQSSLHELLRFQISPNEQTQPSVNPLLRIRAYASSNQQYPCTPQCNCTCHNVHASKSPNFLHNVIGTLFIGYSGYPIQAFQSCLPNCSSSSTFRTCVHYLFPSWLLVKTLTVTLTSLYLKEISISLTIRPVIPNSAEIFRLLRSDDVDSIKRLLVARLASPNDSAADGQTLLHVSCN